MHECLPSRLRKHASTCGWLLLGIGVVLRLLLASYAPRSVGYVWDYYHEGVVLLYAAGRLPGSDACWQCYHPPVFYLLGLPFYAIGRWLVPDSPYFALRVLSMLPLIAGAVAALYAYRLVCVFERDAVLRVLGGGLILAFPCLFISSYAVEADIVLTALMIAFMFYMTRYAKAPDQRPWRSVASLGLLAGLAAATKYNGLVALIAVVLTLAYLLARGKVAAPLALRHGFVIAAIAAVVASPKYLQNAREYGTPFFANGSAAEGLTFKNRRSHWSRYEFTTFRLRELVALSSPDAPPGMLTTLPVYRSVWTTLYGLGWSDMSFFSNHTRHGDPSMPYPDKNIPPWVPTSVLLLGLVPTVLALPGLVVTLPRRDSAPLWITAAVTGVVYVVWFSAQEEWALKTKYILFLLPIYILSALKGYRWVRRNLPSWVADTIFTLLAILVVAAHLYLLAFAIGHL
jgi:hypothetical protein